jgi:hypothetical protein
MKTLSSGALTDEAHRPVRICILKRKKKKVEKEEEKNKSKGERGS